MASLGAGIAPATATVTAPFSAGGTPLAAPMVACGMAASRGPALMPAPRPPMPPRSSCAGAVGTGGSMSLQATVACPLPAPLCLQQFQLDPQAAVNRQPLTAGLADPLTLERQKASYLEALENQRRTFTESLEDQRRRQLEIIRHQTEEQKQQLLARLERESMQKEMMLEKEFADKVMQLNQQYYAEKGKLEQQALLLCNEYQQKSLQEEAAQRQLQLQFERQSMEQQFGTGGTQVTQATQALFGGCGTEQAASVTASSRCHRPSSYVPPLVTQMPTWSGSYVPPPVLPQIKTDVAPDLPAAFQTRPGSYVPPPVACSAPQQMGSYVPPPLVGTDMTLPAADAAALPPASGSWVPPPGGTALPSTERSGEERFPAQSSSSSYVPPECRDPALDALERLGPMVVQPLYRGSKDTQGQLRHYDVPSTCGGA